MKPRFGGINYYKAFDLALTAIDRTLNGYRPFIIFFTAGAASDPEDKYLAKASEIKKGYRNTDFVGIGYGNDFAQNS